jgi:hypothetical protein
MRILASNTARTAFQAAATYVAENGIESIYENFVDAIATAIVEKERKEQENQGVNNV